MKEQNRGFTLIELLVILGIICIIAAIIIPSYNQYKEQEKHAIASGSSILIERALAKSPEGSCYVGVDSFVAPSEIAAFLNKHKEFQLAICREVTAQGIIFKRKNCGE